MGKILEIKNATKRFGGLVANEAVTFDVEEGEIVGVVGPNGAGKTTLFNSISGAHTLTEGNVIFKGKDITSMKPYDICKLGIGRTFQIPQSLNDMMVYENVLVGALCKRHNIEEAMKHVDQILDLLRKVRDEYQMGIVLITHDLGVVSDIADRVIVMYAGKIGRAHV